MDSNDKELASAPIFRPRFVGTPLQVQRNTSIPNSVGTLEVSLKNFLPHRFKVARTLKDGLTGAVTDNLGITPRTRLDLNLDGLTMNVGDYVKLRFIIDPENGYGFGSVWFMEDTPPPSGSPSGTPDSCWAITAGDTEAFAMLHNPVLSNGTGPNTKCKTLEVMCLRRSGLNPEGSFNLGLVFEDTGTIPFPNPFTMDVFFDPKIKNNGTTTTMGGRAARK